MAQKSVSPLNPDVESTSEPMDRKALRREEVITAAIAVFAREGFHQANMAAVAQEAGIAKGTLYLYFKNKEDLFVGAIEARVLPIVEKAQRELKSPEGPAELLLEKQLRFLYEKLISGDLRHVMRLIIAEGPYFPAITAFYHANVITRMQGAFQSLIEYGVERGEFRADVHPESTKILFSGALVAGLWKILFDQYEPLDLDCYFKAHLDIVLNGLKSAQ